MRKLILLFLVTSSFSQEITLNEDLKIYEYAHIKDYSDSEKIQSFYNQLKELSYYDIELSDDNVKGKNFVTKMIMGSAMEVHYNVIISFKENRYRLLINNFTVKDVRYGSVAIETLKKSSQRRWVAFINEELPMIVKKIETSNDW